MYKVKLKLFEQTTHIILYAIFITFRPLTHEKANKFRSQCHYIQLVKGNVKEWHEAVKAFKEYTFDNQRILPFRNTPVGRGKLNTYIFIYLLQLTTTFGSPN